jgi:hypothetical protein
MCSRKESNELFSGQQIGKPQMLQSEKSGGKPLLQVSGGGENEEEETFVRKVEKGVRKQSGNSREIVKGKGVDVLSRDLVERSPCENL